ncbi:MAG: hypothetical protein CFE44_08245 [Burkholderiales bacterium PBB4]|nr:MAG: hypothetical protein CFE44_08245 [Burkholderiales bacterium PBB4]
MFAWNIACGSFSGTKQQYEVPPELFKEAVAYLLDAGSGIGFGDPDSKGWRSVRKSGSTNDEMANFVADMWDSHRDEYEFLVFAIRPKINLPQPMQSRVQNPTCTKFQIGCRHKL